MYTQFMSEEIMLPQSLEGGPCSPQYLAPSISRLGVFRYACENCYSFVYLSTWQTIFRALISGKKTHTRARACVHTSARVWIFFDFKNIKIVSISGVAESVHRKAHVAHEKSVSPPEVPPCRRAL